MREIVSIDCAGETLAATLDHGPHEVGLLIVSGGNEIRIGAHRGMALLAQRIAAAGFPVLRFDRRGIGDSTGQNLGFRSSAEDIAAAAQRLRTAGVRHILAFGNCDAASALALFHKQARLDALILANPWVVETTSGLPPPAAIKSHYIARLKDPCAWLKLISGRLSLSKLYNGLTSLAKKKNDTSNALKDSVAKGLSEADCVTILLANKDNTAIAFVDALSGEAFTHIRESITTHSLNSDSHSFASRDDKDWLFRKILEQLKTLQQRAG